MKTKSEDNDKMKLINKTQRCRKLKLKQNSKTQN